MNVDVDIPESPTSPIITSFNLPFENVAHERELNKQAMQNQGALEQQQLKNEGQSQNVLDNHNANLLQQFAQNSLQSNEPTQPK
jgi:hypothetical protein